MVLSRLDRVHPKDPIQISATATPCRTLLFVILIETAGNKPPFFCLT